MIAYFRRQNILFMALGAAVGLLTAVLGLGRVISMQVVYIRLFMVALCVLAGVVLGRLFSSVWANRKLKELNAVLYQKCNPEEFLNRFIPIAANVPVHTAEHVDAQTKLAYAYEALGEPEQGLTALEGLQPEKLKLHSLQCTALMTNQRMRLYLVKEDTEAASEQLEKMRQLCETAASRAPSLSANLKECIRLGELWLQILLEEDCDLDYLLEEIRLSQNNIHKSEMQLLLARGYLNLGMTLDAKEALLDAVQTMPGLYAGRRAREIYDSLSK